jgi:predicted O-methyltransferase YrrM
VDAVKPYAQACERNRDPILDVLRRYLDGTRRVLEIGSGTGQHAVHFAEHLPQTTWQTADLPENHEGILSWLEGAGLPNARPPLACDLADPDWADRVVEGAGFDAPFDAVFTANTMHIVSWSEAVALVEGAARLLTAGGLLIVYGPFSYGGRYTSPSNEAFDAMLRARDPKSGIRDFEAVDAIAYLGGLRLLADHAMPANNRTVVWKKRS